MTDIVWPYHSLGPEDGHAGACLRHDGRRALLDRCRTGRGLGRRLLGDQLRRYSDRQRPSQKGLAGDLGACRGEAEPPILVPTYDTDTNPWPLANGAPFTAYPDGVPHSDDTLFSDDTGYAQPVIVATVDADVALGANSMVIDLVQGSALEPGQHYSVGVRLFRIKRITAVAGSLYTVTVWPPTREAITAGAIAEFDRPICKCRLATDGEMQSGKDDYAGRTLATVNFVEYSAMSAVAEAYLSGATVRHAYFVEFRFTSSTERVWNGFRNIDLGGHI